VSSLQKAVDEKIEDQRGKDDESSTIQTMMNPYAAGDDDDDEQ